MKRLTYFYDKFYVGFFILLGFLFSFYILYIRLILVRLPRDISPDSPFGLLIIYSFITFIFFVFWFLSIFKLFYPNKQNIVLTFIFSLFKKSLVYFYLFLEKKLLKIFPLYSLYEIITNFLDTYMNTPGFRNLLIFILDFIPKFIVLFAFVLDVWVFHRFDYFYKCSFLLLIPLIFSFFQSVLTALCAKALDRAGKSLFITEENTNKEISARELFVRYSNENHFNIDNYLFKLSFYYEFENQHVAFNYSDTVTYYGSWLLSIFQSKLYFSKLREKHINYWKYTSIIYFGIYAFTWLYVLVISL